MTVAASDGVYGDRKIGFKMHMEDGHDAELLPCPFCGSTNVELCNTHTASYWVECQDCEASVHGGSFDDRFRTRKACLDAHDAAISSAKAKWNKRCAAQQIVR
jgi:ribosomal protein L37AE/L43A